MKKIFSALTLSAFIIIAVTSCKKSQDVMPLTASDASNSVLAINDSITCVALLYCTSLLNFYLSADGTVA